MVAYVKKNHNHERSKRAWKRSWNWDAQRRENRGSIRSLLCSGQIRETESVWDREASLGSNRKKVKHEGVRGR